jgi:DNA mismatch repair ATPase MutS
MAKLLKDKTPTIKLKEMYYPALVGDADYASVVKNSVSLNKNLIITGPNASGKTTTIKSVFLNVLLTQQFGMGCYSGASITPFKHLHCYLNIPDTMGRDSLFQAEARRCKSIIDNVAHNSSGKHLCMFDELFSGTNPEEAVASSERFIKYITKQPNVKWVLTTHFNKLCKSLNKHKQIQNCHMEVTESFAATYKLKKNISNVKGAFKILSDMDFPKEIIDNSFC